MLLTWKNVESLEEPLEIDKNLTTNGVYYRKNIELDEGRYKYEETLLPNEFRFNIDGTQEYITAINQKLNEINGQLHITKLDFYNSFCKPVGISYDTLMAKIIELGMKADWELCNHVYYGIIKPFLDVLPLGKTENEIIAIFEKLTPTT